MNSSEDSNRNEGGWQISVIVIPALLSASTLVTVMVILWKVIWKKRMKEAEPRGAGDEGDWPVNMGGVYEYPMGIPDPELEKKELPRDWRMEERAVLCLGHFGPISRAVLVGEERRDVIIKELSDRCSPGEVQDFMDLLKFYIGVCNHESLVRMLWCQTEVRPMCVIMEAVTPGNLLMFLRGPHQGDDTQSSAHTVTERDVFSMATQVASGLEYLAVSHGLAHGYVAACNLLIHGDRSVRLCGLGLASIQHRSGSVPAWRASRVPIKWQSPQRLQGATVTQHSDVWSFGILLYEMVTLGAPPYPGVDPAKIPKKLQKNYRMMRPRQCGEGLYDVMTTCWQWEEQERPRFTDLLTLLEHESAQADGISPLRACDTLSWPEYLHEAGVPS